MSSTKQYRAALLGCGERSHAHAEVYASIDRADLIATCSRDKEKLVPFSKRYGVTHQYTNFAKMLRKCEPDLLHIVTGPSLRAEVLKIADDCGVPAVLIEKPIALQGEDWRAINKLLKTTDMKVAVNTQLHYHPAVAMLRKRVAAGAIGKIRSVDISSRSTLINQGPHVLQLACGFLSHIPNLQCKQVFAQVSGSEHLRGGREPCPDETLANIHLNKGIQINLAVGKNVGPIVSKYDSIFFHKHITVHGEKGYARWKMDGWELLTEAGLEKADHDYIQENIPAQIDLTNAVFDWLENDKAEPAVSLPNAMREFNAMLGIYMSALTRQPIALPCDPPNDLLLKLTQTLSPTAKADIQINREAAKASVLNQG